MNGCAESPGRLLGSASLRYQRPVPGWQWPPPPVADWALVGCLAPTAEQEGPVGDRGGCRSPRLARLEAILFLGDEPLGSRKIAQLANLADGTEARTLIGALNRLYDTEDCAFRVVEVAGGFQLMTRPEFAPWLQRLQTIPVEVRLSPPALETLAVVAYRQPVLRAEVEAVRGVQCGEILRQLMERELVRIAGRSEELGRPFLYGTTRRFLQVFGLRHLDELPQQEIAPPDADLPPPTDPNQQGRTSAAGEPPSQAAVTSLTEEELNVKCQDRSESVPGEVADPAVIVAVEDEPNQSPPVNEDEDWDDDEEYDDEFDDEEEEDEGEDEEEEGEEEDLDDEENEWVEVTDEEEEEEDEEEEDEDDDWDEDDEDWDEDDEEDWDEEDDDWDEDEDEDEGEDKD